MNWVRVTQLCVASLPDQDRQRALATVMGRVRLGAMGARGQHPECKLGQPSANAGPTNGY